MRNVVLCWLAFTVLGAAQANLAVLSGTVRDAQGGAVAGARLTLRAPATGLRRELQSAADGSFAFPDLPPQAYLLELTAAGFAARMESLTLEVGQHARLDLDLHLQGVTQKVEVRAEGALLHTSDAALGEVIEPKTVEELPLNGRHFLDLALTAPGVHMSRGAQTGSTLPLYWRPGQDAAITVGGNRPNANVYLLDGSTDTDPTFNTFAFSPSPDAIQEFKVQTGSYSAELGGAGGGQINVVTRSGTNQWHGSLYEFLRNNVFDARAFNEPAKLPHLSQNQFGASLGGPLQSNRTFFFVNYEGYRMSHQMTMVETVPTMAERMGDFSQSGLTVYNPFTTHANPNYDPAQPTSAQNSKTLRDAFPDNTIPAALLSPVALAVMNSIPLPNGGKASGANRSGPDANNYLDVRNEHQVTDQATVRLDHNFSGGASLFGRYSLGDEHGFTPQNLPGFGALHDNRAQDLTVSVTQPLSPSSVNSLWVGMMRLAMHRDSENAFTHDYVTQLGIQGVGFGGAEAYGMPAFNVQGYDTMGDSILATPMRSWDTLLQAGDIWTHAMGRHSLKVGGDFRRYLWPMLGFFQNRGYYQFTPGFTTRTSSNDGTGAALASFLLGLPAVAQRQAGIPSMDMRQWYASGFVQDDWRLDAATTLNLGVRYEFMSPLHDLSKPLTNLTVRNGLRYAFIGGQLGMPVGLLYANRTNFAPRLGLAHSVGGRFPFVVRAGYGLFFTPVDMNTWCNQVHNPPLVFAEVKQSDNFVPGISGFNFADPVLGRTPVSLAALDPHSPSEYISQWSLSLEKLLRGNVVVELGYQGSRGYHLQRSHLINNAAPGPGPLKARRPYPTLSFLPGTVLPPGVNAASQTFPVTAINLLENSANSWYDAGWASVRRTVGSRLTLLSNYTWSKNLSDAPDFRSAMYEAAIPQDNSNLRAEKGLACDLRQRFSASLVYTLPGLTSAGRLAQLTRHWQVASIYQAQSGFPFTVSVFGDTANAGTLLGENPVRANRTTAPLFPAGTRTAAQWFNRAAFAAPPAYQFGNAGRNTVIGPGLQMLDLALSRSLALGERGQLQLRSEFFNALNHTNLGSPNRFVNTPQFGTITEAATPGREIQFSARLSF